jgi:uncharacterized protein
MIGLGGGEFRLPVLIYAIGFDAKSAIPLDLLVSFVTLTFPMMVRSHTVPMAALVPYGPEIIGLAFGGGVSAFYGARLVSSLTSERLVKIIGVLLAGLGCLMLLEVARPFGHAALVPDSQLAHLAMGAAIGLGIGLAIIVACSGWQAASCRSPRSCSCSARTSRRQARRGSASILISLGVVLSGLWRYWRIGGLPRGRGVVRITGAMSAGSVIGAVLAGLVVAFAPVAFLKVLLGCVLPAAALKTIASHR